VDMVLTLQLKFSLNNVVVLQLTFGEIAHFSDHLKFHSVLFSKLFSWTMNSTNPVMSMCIIN